MNGAGFAVGRRVYRLRSDAALTQEALTEIVDLSVEAIQRIERTSRAHAESIAAVAAALAVESSAILSPRTRVIACMNEKGGCGRTTVTYQSLGVARISRRVGLRGSADD